MHLHLIISHDSELAMLVAVIGQEAGIPPAIAALVLLAAGAHATWNALAKRSPSQEMAFFYINATVAVIGVGLELSLGLPVEAALPFVLGSAAIHVAYNLFLLGSYQRGDLSLAYPIARGLAPLAVAGGAWLIAGEQLTTTQILAVAVIGAGLISLARVNGPGSRRAVAFSLATGVTIAAYSMLDGLGVRHAQGTLPYIGALFAMEGTAISVVIASLRHRRGERLLPKPSLAAIEAGAISFLAYAAVLYAQRRAELALVSALRETSVVVAMVIGHLWLREEITPKKIAASVAITIGVAALVLLH